MKRFRWIALAFGFAALGPACAEPIERPDGWGELSHSNDAEPDYLTVFDETAVRRFDIEVSPSDYQDTMEDLAQLLSGGGRPGDSTTEDPMWVPVTVRTDELTWWHVGMRYKGNSSLRSAWQQGIRKLAFRLNFDKFEDDYPEVDDQRFYGFKKMTFSNGFKDPSLIRDKVGADIFRAGGIRAAHGTFARVYVDFGEGPTYFGLYTMIEDPSDAMLDVQFGDGSGNLYKPESSWTSFDESEFTKKTNEEDSDYRDVQAAVVALNSNATGASWRAGLEEHFDVHAFLRNQAINQVMVNWDSYGCMPHNYYVYADPSDGGRLVWFPWDLNESMLSGGMRDCHPESIMLDEIDARWPLIRELLDDDEYRAFYRNELELALDGAFEQSALTALMEQYHDLIAPYVTGEVDQERSPYTFLDSSSSFLTSLRGGSDALVDHVSARQTAVRSALGL